MREILRAVSVVLVLTLIAGCSCPRPDRETLYQVATLQALMEGVYDGAVSLGDLRQRGDVGIGTFEGLDGEMILTRGRMFQIRADGKAYTPADGVKSPFACVTFFDTDIVCPLPKGTDYEVTKRLLDKVAPAANIPCAIRLTGTFARVKTRSVPAQQKPYPKLTEVVKNQPTFEFENVRGTMVGFRLPDYMAGINAAGYHLHFLDEAETGGGHVLEFTVENALAEVDATPQFALALPEGGGFTDTDLSGTTTDDVHRVEQ